MQRMRNMEDKLSVWEGEGGAVSKRSWNVFTGTANQIEWAERIRMQVDAEFDRVARLRERLPSNKSGQKRSDTRTMMGILEQKRAAVLGSREAGYFIHGLAGTARPGQ